MSDKASDKTSDKLLPCPFCGGENIHSTYFFKGCDIENDVARMYEIKRTMVKIEELMPDAEAIMNKEEM